MNNIDIIKAVTENLKSIFKGEGIDLSEKVFKSSHNLPKGAKPPGSRPLGRLDYKGEAFEYGYGARAYYANARFGLSLFLRDSNEKNLTRLTQEWVHKIREALTVNGVNVGSLASIKPVTRAEIDKVQVISDGKEQSVEVRFDVFIRYREV